MRRGSKEVTSLPVATSYDRVEQGSSAALGADAAAAANQPEENEVNFGEDMHSRFWILFNTYSPIRQADGYEYKYYINTKFFLVLLAGLIVIAACVPESFHYIDYYEYGLKRDNYGGVSLSPTYTQGRYFETLNYGYVMFPATYQKMDFKSTVFADNGMEFDLHVRFYYRIPKDSVGAIYDKFSKSYPSRIENNGKKVIKNVCAGFKVDDYLSNRSLIEDLIAGNISQELHEVVGVETPANFVKIVDMIFPSSLIATSLDSALALQQNELNQITQVVELIQSTTSQQVAEVNAQKELLLQNADNLAAQIVGTARAQASNVVNSARAVGMTGMFEALNITDPADIALLVDAMALYDTEAGTATIMSGVTAGSVVNV